MGMKMLRASEDTGKNLGAYFVASVLQKIKCVISFTAPEPDEKLHPRLKPGWWFWAAMFIGLVIRIYCVVFTQGTYDVDMWQKDAIGVQTKGLISHYHSNEEMTRPPFIAYIATGLWSASQKTGIPFRILLRASIAVLDGGTMILLLCILRGNRYRFLITAGYWLHPLAIIFSAYHGNVDSAVAFFLILCLYFLSKGSVTMAGVAIGMSLWVKPPTILAIPAFVFALPDWRKRLSFLAAIAVVGISTYIPTILEDPLIVYQRVFGYHGQFIHTTAGIFVWGTRIFLVPFFNSLSLQWQKILVDPLNFLVAQSWSISILLIILFSWLRRFQRTTAQLGATIAAVYAILYGFTNYWSFQYFAWSVPFWFFAPPVFLIGATLLAGGYIYSLYWLLCGNGWLLGNWDFIGHPYWSPIVMLFRNLAVLFFFISGCVFLSIAICKQIACWSRLAKDNSRRVAES
jgi:hypothetical protein